MDCATCPARTPLVAIADTTESSSQPTMSSNAAAPMMS